MVVPKLICEVSGASGLAWFANVESGALFEFENS
jgi:hypothetical protein